MSCANIESDLLLYSLGELPYWRSWAVSRHLAKCGSCRERQVMLAATSRQIAEALRPPGGGPRLPARPPVSVGQGWLMVASLVLVVAVGLLTVYVAETRYSAWQAARQAQQDRPCLPGLASDKCR